MPDESFTADTRPPPNRLSIGHLLLWTAASAVAVIGIMPQRDDEISGALPDAVADEINWQRNAQRMVVVVIGPILGAGLSALAIAAWRAHRRRPGFPTAPGHWLLMIIGAVALAGLYVRFHQFIVPNPSFDSATDLSLWLVWLLPVVMLLVAFACVHEPPRWRRVFRIAIYSGCLFFIFGCIPPPAFLFVAIACFLAGPLSVVVAGVLDWQLGVRWDVFHWAGVVAVPALAAIVLIVMLLL